MISSCGIGNKDIEKKSENLKTIFEKTKPIKENPFFDSSKSLNISRNNQFDQTIGPDENI